MAVKKAASTEKKESKSGYSNKAQKIQELAYAHYLERVRQNIPGDAMADWAAAENQAQTEFRN